MALRLSSICVLTILVGCAGGDKGATETGAAEDDTGTGGGGTTWRPAGDGSAYFADGDADNSLFHLEMSRAVEPREGEDYYGFITREGEDPIELGRIDVDSEDFVFEEDVGFNAVIEGYDGFEAWANDNGDIGDGDALWIGAVDPVVYVVIQDILISSPSTPSGEGTLRATETLIQGMQTLAEETSDGSHAVAEIQSAGEQIFNALENEGDDVNDDGEVEMYGDGLYVGDGSVDDDGSIRLVLDSLTLASQQMDPRDPVRQYIEDAYDCTQRIWDDNNGNGARYAKVDAGAAGAITDVDAGTARLADVATTLDAVLTGADVDEDGEVDLLTEGTLDCAVLLVSRMATMEVSTP